MFGEVAAKPRRIQILHTRSKLRSTLTRRIKIDNAETAKRILINIRKRVLLLQENVFLEPVFPDVANKMIREVIYKNYRIIYTIKSDTIEIITVFEGHKLLDESNL